MEPKTDRDTPLSVKTLLAELEALRRNHGIGQNVGCVEIEGCVACSDCVFSSGCERCHRLRYSDHCRDCYDLTHCSHCERCYATAFADHCDQCVGCSHVAWCSNCSGCDYCFGCVGLVDKDFHILNRKYSRGEYFRMVKRLQAELKARG